MIPVHEPELTNDDINAVLDVLQRGEISGSFGEAIPAFEQAFASYCGCKYGVAVSNGTTALQLAVAVGGIGPGDEVLVSSSTNIATALAAYHNGAVPVPVDSEDVTWNMDLDLIERLITPKTRAILPVHLFGHPVDMDRLIEIARKHHLLVIEDCAESHGSTVRGRMTGSFGDMACYSFYANKIITTGEGGMVVTNNEMYANRLRLLRNLAFKVPRFLHEEAGYNFRMTGMQAALGHSQLERIDSIIERKRRIAHGYNRELANVPGIQTPVELPWAKNVYWMYAVVVKPEFGIDRDQLSEALRGMGIDSRTFFCPMSRQPFLMKQHGFRFVPCPVADRLWESGLYLPSSNTTDTDTIAKICEAIVAARPS